LRVYSIIFWDALSPAVIINILDELSSVAVQGVISFELQDHLWVGDVLVLQGKLWVASVSLLEEFDCQWRKYLFNRYPEGVGKEA
jgi:hypothetical protein